MAQDSAAVEAVAAIVAEAVVVEEAVVGVVAADSGELTRNNLLYKQ